MATVNVTATFDGTTDTVAVAYTGITASSPDVIAGDAVMTNTADPAPIVGISGIPTSSGCTVKASASFVGSVNLIVIG